MSDEQLHEAAIAAGIESESGGRAEARTTVEVEDWRGYAELFMSDPHRGEARAILTPEQAGEIGEALLGYAEAEDEEEVEV